MYRNIFEELAFKFGNLEDLRPDNIKSKITIFENLVTDDFVNKINPKRYIFYNEFMRALRNPDLLKNIIYETKLIKNDKENEKNIINEITSRINQLYTLDYKKNISNKDYIDNKKKIIKLEDERITRKIKKLVKTYDDIPDEIIKTDGIIDQTFKENIVGGDGVGGVGDLGVGSLDGVDLGDLGSTDSFNFGDISSNDQQQPDNYRKKYIEIEEKIKIEIDKGEKVNHDTLKLYKFNLEALKDEIKKDAQNPDNDNIISNIDDKIKIIDDILDQNYKENIEKIESARELLEEEISNLKKSNEEEKKKIKINKDKAKDIADKVKNNFINSNDNLLHLFRRQLKDVYDNTDDKLIKASRLNDIVNEIENNEFISINHLKISREDRLVFIGITFLVRLISLVIIDWALNTNYIVSFTQAYVLYVVLYCIFVMIIIVIVNMTYIFPLYKLYNGEHGIFTTIASAMYYFYLIPGNILSNSIRFIIHFSLIIFLTVITIIIKNNENKDDNILNYDYSERKNIRRALSNFTLILWFFTSVIAMYMF